MSGRVADAPAGRRPSWARLHRFLSLSAFVATMIAAPFAQAQTPGDTAPAFEIRRFTVEGNTVLAGARIDAILAPYTGTARSFADLQAAVAALQAAYAQAGFGAVTVALPEQAVASGTVRLEVVEARLRNVKVEGLTHADEGNIRRSLPSLQAGATPNTDDLAREIRLANENPAKRVSVDLKSEASGQIDAIVAVLDERPWRVGASIDDTGTPTTGRNRVGVFYQHANVTDLDHVATLQYLTSPEQPSDVTIAALNYRVPLPSFGDSIDVFAVYANVDSGVVGDLFNVRGSGTTVGVRYNKNLRPTASYQHRWLYGLEQRRIENRVGPVGGSPDLVPSVTLHPASIGYAGTWSGDGRQLDFSGTGVRNIPGGALGGSADFAAARAGASARYLIFRYAANLVQTLPSDWQLRVAVDGQYTQDALVSAEQFGIGGRDSVRGFDERELTNDLGNRVTLEIQTPNIGEQLIPGAAARALVFADQGWLRRNHPLPGEVVHSHISSVGVGLRLAMASSWNVRVDAAHVTEGAGVRPRGDERLHFSIVYAY
jgi:hemolysin activation/secretion protein